MMSSANRDRLTPIMDRTKAASAAKSRAAVASIELSAAASKPSSSAIASGSSPSDDPASAPDPYGDTAARLSKSASRSTSRSSGCACASKWCASSTGWADCRCVLPGMIAVGCAAAWVASVPTTSSTPSATRRTASRSHSRKSVATWSFRDRPARSRPPRFSPTRSIRPRSSAPCTSSSVTSGPKLPSATSSARLSRPTSRPSRCSSVSSPARDSTRACAFDAATSYGASTQSKCVDLLSAARASDGPSANRPPHSEPSLVLMTTPETAPRSTFWRIPLALSRRNVRLGVESWCSLAGEVPAGGDLRRQAMHMHEALGRRLVERVALVVGREIEVVQRLGAAPAVDRNVPAVQHHPDLARHVLLRLGDERLQRRLQRRVPQAVVYQLTPLLIGVPLEPAEFAFQRDVLEFGMRGDEHHRARRLIDFAALDADQPVLDHVQPTDSLRTRALVELLDRLQRSDRPAIDRNRHAPFESDDDLVGRAPVDGRVLGVVVYVLGRRIPEVLEEAGLHRPAPHVLVDRERRALGDVDRNGVLLGERDGLLARPRVVPDRGQHLQIRCQRSESDLEADLVVTLAGAAVCDDAATVLPGRGHQVLDDQR